MTPSGRQVEAAQDEIRRAARRLRYGKALLSGWLSSIAVWLALKECLLSSEAPRISWGIVLFLLVACSLVTWVAPPVVAGARGVRRRRLRARLSRLAPAERAEVLLPVLGTGDQEARRLVLPLLRDFGIAPTEVVPAPARDGRATEVAPASEGPGRGRRARRTASMRLRSGTGLAAATRGLRVLILTLPLWLLAAMPFARGGREFGFRIAGTESYVSGYRCDADGRRPGWSWSDPVPRGLSCSSYMLFSFTGETAYAVRIGDCVWQLGVYYHP